MSPQPVALVTGASRGIGASIALELARRDYAVVLTARDAGRLAALQEQIVSRGGTATAVAGNLEDLDFAETLVRNTIAQYGRVDVLVNNAIWREITTMRDISLASWERTLRLGVTLPAFLARWCAESMERQRQGVIINISSIMARQAGGFSPAYIACKGALDSLTYELAALYGPSGIRVVSIAPGAIDTELSRDLGETHPQEPQTATTQTAITQAGDSTIDVEQFSQQMISLGRWGTADEIAHLVAFVASDQASYITGTTITADGGWRHQHLPRPLRDLMQGRGQS